MKPTLLLIDDDDDMIALLSINLKNDFQVFSENRASESIKRAGQLKPNVVLLDLHMPNIDGYEVLKQFKNHPSTASLPVICMSADDSEHARERAYVLGAIGFIKKPPNIKQIGQDVKNFVANINPRLESSDKRVQFTIAFNESEKSTLLDLQLAEFEKTNEKVILLSWKEGREFFSNRNSSAVADENLVYFKIKPSLITKFPFMQELKPIVSDLQNFLVDDLQKFNVVLDEPSMLLDQNDSGNSAAKMYSFTELLTQNFKSVRCFSTKQRDPQKDLFLMSIAKTFVGLSN